MTAIVTQGSTKLSRFPWMAGIAGLLVGLAIVWFWRDFANWWAIEPYRSGLTYAMMWGDIGWDLVSPVVFGQLVIVGFLHTLMLPGQGKLPIFACLLHNQPQNRTFFSWILRAWGLKCGMLAVVFCNVLFLKYVSFTTLNLYISIINGIGYLITILLALLLVRDAWRLSRSSSTSLSQLRLPLVLVLGFQFPWYAVFALHSAREYEHMLLGWSMVAAMMTGILLAYLVTAWLALVVRNMLGEAACQARRGQFALFSAMVMLCVTGKILFIFALQILK